LSATDPAITDPAVADPVADRPRVVLQASGESWVEIRDRFNKRVLSRLMAPGERLEVPDETGLRLTVGNAGGIVISVDGQAIPPLGGPGVVRRNVSLEAALLQHADSVAN
jgi:cytoskeleton protein RodZ